MRARLTHIQAHGRSHQEFHISKHIMPQSISDGIPCNNTKAYCFSLISSWNLWCWKFNDSDGSLGISGCKLLWNFEFQPPEKSKVTFGIFIIPTSFALLDAPVERRIEEFHQGDNFWRIYKFSIQQFLKFCWRIIPQVSEWNSEC